MSNKNFNLRPIIVNQLVFSSKTQSRGNLKLDVKSKFSVQDISELNNQQYLAIIRCELTIHSKDRDAFSLAMNSSAILDCQEIDSETSFKQLIEKQGIPRFMEELRKIVADITQSLGCGVLNI